MSAFSMNKITIFVFLIMYFFSCSPKLTTIVYNPQPPLVEEDIVVLKKEDLFQNTGIEVGSVSAGDNGFSTNCSYNEVIKILKEKARQNGANILKITEHKLPDGRKSTCDRIKAKIYRVNNAKQYEKEIEWSPARKFNWSDFKGMSSTSRNIGESTAATYCEIGFRTNYVTIFTKMKSFVTTSFFCDSSWVKPEGLNSENLLLHEQTHFDLAELYARQLHKELSEKKYTFLNSIKEANEIYYQVYHNYYRRQRRFDDETDHGRNSAKEKKWEETVRKELSNLNTFSQ